MKTVFVTIGLILVAIALTGIGILNGLDDGDEDTLL